MTRPCSAGAGQGFPILGGIGTKWPYFTSLCCHNLLITLWVTKQGALAGATKRPEGVWQMRLKFMAVIAGALFSTAALAVDYVIPHEDLVTCKLNAYSVYQVARKRGYTFRCEGSRSGTAMFVTEKSTRSIGCEGRVKQAFGVPEVEHIVESKLFGQAGTMLPRLYNGWSMTSYLVSGGDYKAVLDADDALVDYKFVLRGEGTQDRRLIKYIRIEKVRGDCDKALEEAFSYKTANMAD